LQALEDVVARLKVLCARSMTKVVDRIAEGFRRESGHAVDIDYGTVGALQQRIDAGESADVTILSASMISRMGKAGALREGTETPIAGTSIGVAVRQGEAGPDIATPEAFRQALVAAGGVAFSDAAVGGTAGVYLVGLFDDLGLASEMKRKGQPQKNGAEVARRVADGSADLGMTLMAEIAPIPGVRIIGPLPPPLGHGAAYRAAVTTGCTAPEAASAFIAALVAPATRALWSDAGFELPGGA
jgi:molybdate transport system substrate-binding protein